MLPSRSWTKTSETPGASVGTSNKRNPPSKQRRGYPYTRGGKPGVHNKRAIVSLVQRGGGVRSFHVENADLSTVSVIVSKNIAQEARVMTDESRIYIVESRSRPRAIRVYDVIEDGTKLANGRIFGDIGEGAPDGFRCDVHGNLWCGWGPGESNGVAIFAPDGKMIGRIALPERCANVCFGGRSRNRLFMAASQSIYSLFVEATGAHIA